MTRLFAPIALLIACASLAGAQPFPQTLLDMAAVDGAVKASPPPLAGVTAGLDEIVLPDESSFAGSSLATGPVSSRHTHGDSLLNGALIGAGVGAALCVIYFHDEVPAAGLPLIVGLYALAGAWIDARVEAVHPVGSGVGGQRPVGRPELRASVNARVRF